jgi:class 3 adenylate cyclase
MERFYGALLFVDISGFTAMASKMNVDDLRTHINAYFTMIINIVVKHGGEVVKFAGDALYIVWQINREVLLIAGQSIEHLLSIFLFFHHLNSQI